MMRPDGWFYTATIMLPADLPGASIETVIGYIREDGEAVLEGLTIAARWEADDLWDLRGMVQTAADQLASEGVVLSVDRRQAFPL